MLAKLEPFSEFQPTKPLSYKIEQLLRQYKVTDFICNSFEDTLLLEAGITENVKSLGVEFIKPDFVRVGMIVESEKLEKIESFFNFLQLYDSKATLEHIENASYSIRMDCTTCLEKVYPIFEKAFLKRIQADPNCLKFYQEESEREYSKFLEKKLEGIGIEPPVVTPTLPQNKRGMFFSNANTKTSATSISSSESEDLNNYLQAK